MAHETHQFTTLDFGLLACISSKNSRVVVEDQQSINKSLTAFFTSDSNLTDAFNTLAERDQKFVISLFLRVCIGDKTADAEQQMDRKIRDGMSDSGNSFVAALKDLLGQEYNRRREISVKKDNEAQNELFSQPFTIWHAVSKFGESRGRTSWCVVKYVVSFLSKEKISCPWMRGDDLGVFGETPLHVALLCNEPSYEAEDMFLFLWKHCENIRDKKYSEKKYEGENVLHLAIVRNFSVEFLEKIYEIDRARWGELLKAAATGDFFNDKEEGCHMLGELPLFFAACYDRRDVFEYLVKTGSKLIDVTSKGNNLLHVMIEREKVVSCSEVTTKLSMLEMLDCVFKTLHNKEDLEGKPIYDDLIHQRNKAGQTPIMLAAAMGSPQIFEYFFESTNVDVAWVYGSVECVKIRLDGSDPAFCDSKGTSAIRSGESVLDLLVKSKRRDILTTSIIGQVIERKWEKYGSTIFCTRLFLSSLYALAVVLVPVFEWTSIRAAVHVFAIFILDQITHPKYFSESLLSQFVYRPLNKEQIVVGSQRFVGRVIIDVVSWALWQLPLLSGGSASLRTFLLPRLSVWVLKASFLVFVFGLVAEQPLNTYWIVHEYPVLHYLQTILYASSGILAFCNIVSSLIVFEGYGSLVFMLTNTLRRDLPMFAVAYVIFLICFAYYHFLASNNLHSGLLSQGGDSMWRIFSAMVGEFVDEDQKICQYTSTRVIVMGISVANYFFVTVVLVNLLIAFLTNTIEEISNEACMEWRLQRARILLEEDARLSDQQMDSMKYLMSKPDVLDSDSTLLTSTKSLKGLPSRSKKDLHNTNKSEPRDRFFFVTRMRELEAIQMDELTSNSSGNPVTTPTAKADSNDTQSGMKRPLERRMESNRALSDRRLSQVEVNIEEEQAIRFLAAWSKGADADTGGQGITLSAAQSEQIFKLFYTVCFPLASEASIQELHQTFLRSESNVEPIDRFKSKLIDFKKSRQHDLKQELEDRNPVDDSDFDQLNRMRLRRNAVKYSIWNAVSSFMSKQGRNSWEVVKAVVKILNSNGADCPWMRGDERGVYGETPLHLALLCNKPGNKDFESMFTFLWDECPCLRSLEYNGMHYRGENILHLAIVRGFSIQFLQRIRSNKDEWNVLMNSRAIGGFFSEPQYGIAPLGELPLFFAACVNRHDVFQFLAPDHKELLLATTGENANNLLHVLILKEAAGGLWGSSGRSCNESRLRINTIEAVLQTLKEIVVKAEASSGQSTESQSKTPAQTTVFERLMLQTNSDGYTPLALAAAKGSWKMFCHLFDSETSIAWVYGPVTCTKLYLDGMDVELPDEKTSVQSARSKEESGKDEKSILKLLAEHGRSDILSHSCIDKLVDIKWRKYGERIFKRKLILSLLIGGVTFVLPMIHAETTLLWKIVHTMCHFFVAFGTHFEDSRKQKRASGLTRLIFGYPPIKSGGDVIIVCKDICLELVGFFPNAVLSVRDGMTALWQAVKFSFHAFDSPDDDAPKGIITSLIKRQGPMSELNSAEAPADAPSRIWEGLTKSAAVVSFFLLCSFVVRSWAPASCYPPEASMGGLLPTMIIEVGAVLFHTLEISLYAILGLVNFWNFVSLMVAIDFECGLYIQMLLNITCQDLPIFFAVYTIVLLMFSYCHYLASNQVSSGLGEAMDSIWGIFSAMIGKFHMDSTKVSTDSPFLIMVTAISVANYFLVTVVLVNLLIAQISNTFKETKAAAEGLRKLRRARIMVAIDKAMSAEQRKDKDFVYWYAGSDGRR